MNRVLVIKLRALGDVVMSTPLIDAIQKFHHNAELHLLTTPAFAPLFDAWPNLEVASFPRRGWRSMFKLVRWLRQAEFDRIYDLQGNDRTAIWCALSGSPERVGNHNRYPNTHHPPNAWHGQCHIFDRMVAVLASAGISEVDRRPVLPRGKDEQHHVEQWLARKHLGAGGFAILHAGASIARRDKIWPHFATLAERIAESGMRIVWIGGEPDRERNAALAAATGIDSTGEFSVTEIAALGEHARFAVTNDSGPMHVLSASRIPVFGLFGPSDWHRNHALGQVDRVIACVEHDAAYSSKASADCLASIPPEVVHARLVAENLL